MPLESTVVCVDNSEFSRNGDFAPTRLEAVRSAARSVINTKLQDNPESTCAVLSMGSKIDVLSTLTTDSSKLSHCLHGVTSHGTSDFLNGLLVALLILRQRQTKRHRPRVVAFVGSPIAASKKEIVQVAKKLKKSGVFVDIISYGDETENQEKLEAFLEAVNKDNESHLVVVPSGSGSLTSAITSSGMLGEAAVHQPAGDFGGFGGEEDPELAMVLRMSLEEEMQRQRNQQSGDGQGDSAAQDATAADLGVDPELAAALLASQQDINHGPGGDEAAEAPSEGADAPASSATAPSSASAPAATAAQSAPAEPDFGAMTEDEMLQYALAMSLSDANVNQGADEPASDMDTATDGGSKPEATSSDAAPAAEAPSSSSATEPKAPAAPAIDELAGQTDDVFGDPEFLASIIGDLPGVDTADAGLQEMLASLQGDDQSSEKKKKEDDTDMDIDDVDD